MFILAGNAILILFIITTGLTGVSNNNQNPVEKISKLLQSPTPTPTPSPTSTPTPTVTPTFTPTPTPTATPKPTKNPDPTSSPEETKSNIPSDTGGNIGLSLMNQINNFRSSKGLSALSTDGYTCAFASLRAGEIVGGFNHDGFTNRINSHSLPYPSYSSVAENIAMNSNSNAVVQGWIDSPGHNENMSKDVPYGCVGVSGNYYTFEAWKP